MEPIAVVLAAVSAVALAAVSVLVVLTSLEKQSRRLNWLRLLAVAVSASLVGLACGYPARLAEALGMLALLLGLLAVALAFGMPPSLEHWARRQGFQVDEAVEPTLAWWPEFERAFHRYVDADGRAAATQRYGRDARPPREEGERL